HSLGVYLTGMSPPWTVQLPSVSAFHIDPPLPLTDYKGPERANGLLLGFFGVTDKNRSHVTHAVVVNLDYKKELTIQLRGASALEVFDAANSKWSGLAEKRMELKLDGGSGTLVRLK
ncbi:MAG: hypothetical protein JWM99_4121, partial [Verrucomicrobiales bacterium]|nr:hypothetical protein [Verrucomicrobiales bacterium]